MSALTPGAGDGLRHVPFDAGSAEDSFQHFVFSVGGSLQHLYPNCPWGGGGEGR